MRHDCPVCGKAGVTHDPDIECESCRRRAVKSLNNYLKLITSGLQISTHRHRKEAVHAR